MKNESETYKDKGRKNKKLSEILTFPHFAENPVCKYNKKKKSTRLDASEQVINSSITHGSEESIIK